MNLKAKTLTTFVRCIQLWRCCDGRKTFMTCSTASGSQSSRKFEKELFRLLDNKNPSNVRHKLSSCSMAQHEWSRSETKMESSCALFSNKSSRESDKRTAELQICRLKRAADTFFPIKQKSRHEPKDVANWNSNGDNVEYEILHAHNCCPINLNRNTLCLNIRGGKGEKVI